MTTFSDFAAIDGHNPFIDPKELVIPPNGIELPLFATEKLMVDLGSFDKYADNIDNVSVKFKSSEGDILVESSDSQPVQNDGKALYSFLIDGSLINKGSYTADWQWRINRGNNSFNRRATTEYYAFFQSPTYYWLTDGEKLIARAVMARFSDLFDNTLGQSKFNFYENYQSSYGIERIAQMMNIACRSINVEMTPATSYNVGGQGNNFPERWYSVLEVATYVELLRHAVRSYVEQPAIAGSTDIPYADRRDYLQRWASVLEETKAGLRAQIAAMRRGHLNLGGVSSIVSGGIYGNYTGAVQALEQGRMRSAYNPVLIRR